MRVLVLTHRLPYAPNRGDRIRSYHLLRLLSETMEVHLFSLAEAAELPELPTLESWMASVTVAIPNSFGNRVRGALSLAGGRPLTHALLDAPGSEAQVSSIAHQVRPDVVLAYCSGMARFSVDGPLRHLPWVLDMVDVDSAKWAALSRSNSQPMRWIYGREARVLGEFEARACRQAAATLVVNEREREAVEAIAPGANVAVVENGVDVEFFAPDGPPAASEHVVFCGVMDYQPNVEGVLWFVERVWPGVREIFPEARFTIAGARPSPGISAMHGRNGIEVTGSVPDVRPYLWRAAVSVAPLLTARGLQNKVLEALAAGLPTVVTRAVAEGLPGAALPACDVTDDPREWVRKIALLLHSTPDERRRLSQRADLSGLTWRARLREVPSILSAAAVPGPSAPQKPNSDDARPE